MENEKVSGVNRENVEGLSIGGNIVGFLSRCKGVECGEPIRIYLF